MTEAVIDKEKVYKATTGEEAIDLILNKFYEELVNSGMFPLHRTWHEFEFLGGVRVKGWSTKTEEVKFSVGEPVSETPPLPDAELVTGRVDATLAPAPPSLLRESFPDIPCPKCRKIFHSKPALNGHLNRWCKAPEKVEEDTNGVSVRTDNANLSESDSGQVASNQTADAT